MPARPVPQGTPAPWFSGRTTANPKFVFDTVAGRYVVLCLFRSAADPFVTEVLEQVDALAHLFDDVNICFFGVTMDPADESGGRLVDRVPGRRHFWDFDGAISRLYGALGEDGQYRMLTYVLDPRLRVLGCIPQGDTAAAHVAELRAILQQVERFPPPALASIQAPILVVPRIFEPRLCRTLIEYYDAQGGRDSGFMRDVNGRTVQIVDHGHKRRRDCTIEDQQLRQACMVRLHDRLGPEIHKAFQFRVTRMERHIVACYDESEGGHFRPHRDNTTKGTAHRRFAVSLFLNAGEYEGGHLRFPEYGPALYTAPAGGAVVFSCSLLHEAMPVTRGRRMMFLPFLYDDDARKIRERNFQFLEAALQADTDVGS